MYIQNHLIFDLSLLVVCTVALGKSFDFVRVLSQLSQNTCQAESNIARIFK